MLLKLIRWVTNCAIVLALFVVMLGAYTRLTDAGLGCPDWPGCYGHMVLPMGYAGALPMEPQKAWTEMVHRYVAGSLGMLIFILGLAVGRARLQGFSVPWKLSLFLLLLVVFQAMLGMWTVTLKLLPVIVMGHLLGGMLVFGGLCYFRMQLSSERTRAGCWTFLGVLLVVFQIALGGWVSSNYAGLACIGFPTCNGSWWPALDFSHGFYLFSPVGDNYQGGLLSHHARMTIQWVHRLGALVVFLYVSWLSLSMMFGSSDRRLRQVALGAVLLVTLQCALGVSNVLYLMPLWIADLHNGVAAVLLATLLWLHHLGGSPHAKQC